MMVSLLNYHCQAFGINTVLSQEVAVRLTHLYAYRNLYKAETSTLSLCESFLFELLKYDLRQ